MEWDPCHGMGIISIFVARYLRARKWGVTEFWVFYWLYQPCFLFGNSPSLKGLYLFLSGLKWPSYGYVVPQNMVYYLRIRTYIHVYVCTLFYYVCAYTYIIYTYLYSYTTHMYEFIIRTYTYYITIYVAIIFRHVYVPIYTYMSTYLYYTDTQYTWNNSRIINYTYVFLVGYVYPKILLHTFVHVVILLTKSGNYLLRRDLP